MDEPSHPMKHQYTKPHTFAWSKRGASAEQAGGHRQLWRSLRGKPGVTALEPVLVGVGLVRAGAEVEIPFAATRLVDGVFVAQEKNTAVMIKQLVGLATLAETLKPLR